MVSCSSSNDETLAPNDENNQPTTEAITISKNYTTNTILENHTTGVDYIIDGQIEIKSLVTIEPGTTIIFKSDASLFVDKNGGVLSAIGTVTEPITFKGEQSTSGFWRGIGFYSADTRNELNHVIITDAGSNPVKDLYYDYKTAIVVIDGSTVGKLSLKNSIIKNNDGIGLAIENDASLREYSNNNFEKNTEQAVRLSANNVSKIDSNSTYTDNGFNGVSIRKSILNEGIEHTWKGINYKVDGKITIKKGLKILPSANLEFTSNGYIFVDKSNAYINALGTASNNITFTGEVSSSGSWKGIGIHSANTLNQFNYCNITYAGSDRIHPWVTQKAILTLYDALGTTSKVIVKNCNIGYSDGHGIIVEDNSVLTQSGNSFTSIVGNNILRL